MAKLYTKAGDKGYTSLYDQKGLSKGDVIFDFLGDLDELSAHIGMLHALLKENEQIALSLLDCGVLRIIQLKLLDIGSNIATTKEKRRTTGVDMVDIMYLEKLIDAYEEQNTKLTEFIVPGVQPTDSQVHICRAVSRRVERHLSRLETNVDDEIRQYLNRLSDFFFALGRRIGNGKELKRSEIQAWYLKNRSCVINV